MSQRHLKSDVEVREVLHGARSWGTMFEEGSELSKRLELLLGYYGPCSGPSADALKGGCVPLSPGDDPQTLPGGEKTQAFCLGLSWLLGLDELQALHALHAALVGIGGGSASWDDVESTDILEAARSCHFSQRLDLLKMLQDLLRIDQDGSHPYHNEVRSVLDQRDAKNRLSADLMSQLRALQEEELPVLSATELKERLPWMTKKGATVLIESHLVQWIQQRAREMAEIAECLVLIFYARASPSPPLMFSALSLLEESDLGMAWQGFSMLSEGSPSANAVQMTAALLRNRLVVWGVEVMQLWRFSTGGGEGEADRTVEDHPALSAAPSSSPSLEEVGSLLMKFGDTRSSEVGRRGKALILLAGGLLLHLGLQSQPASLQWMDSGRAQSIVEKANALDCIAELDLLISVLVEGGGRLLFRDGSGMAGITGSTTSLLRPTSRSVAYASVLNDLLGALLLTLYSNNPIDPEGLSPRNANNVANLSSMASRTFRGQHELCWRFWRSWGSGGSPFSILLNAALNLSAHCVTPLLDLLDSLVADAQSALSVFDLLASWGSDSSTSSSGSGKFLVSLPAEAQGTLWEWVSFDPEASTGVVQLLLDWVVPAAQGCKTLRAKSRGSYVCISADDSAILAAFTVHFSLWAVVICRLAAAVGDSDMSEEACSACSLMNSLFAQMPSLLGSLSDLLMEWATLETVSQSDFDIHLDMVAARKLTLKDLSVLQGSELLKLGVVGAAAQEKLRLCASNPLPLRDGNAFFHDQLVGILLRMLESLVDPLGPGDLAGSGGTSDAMVCVFKSAEASMSLLATIACGEERAWINSIMRGLRQRPRGFEWGSDGLIRSLQLAIHGISATEWRRRLTMGMLDLARGLLGDIGRPQARHSPFHSFLLRSDTDGTGCISREALRISLWECDLRLSPLAMGALFAQLGQGVNGDCDPGCVDYTRLLSGSIVPHHSDATVAQELGWLKDRILAGKTSLSGRLCSEAARQICTEFILFVSTCLSTKEAPTVEGGRSASFESAGTALPSPELAIAAMRAIRSLLAPPDLRRAPAGSASDAAVGSRLSLIEGVVNDAGLLYATLKCMDVLACNAMATLRSGASRGRRLQSLWRVRKRKSDVESGGSAPDKPTSLMPIMPAELAYIHFDSRSGGESSEHPPMASQALVLESFTLLLRFLRLAGPIAVSALMQPVDSVVGWRWQDLGFVAPTHTLLAASYLQFPRGPDPMSAALRLAATRTLTAVMRSSQTPGQGPQTPLLLMDAMGAASVPQLGHCLLTTLSLASEPTELRIAVLELLTTAVELQPALAMVLLVPKHSPTSSPLVTPAPSLASIILELLGDPPRMMQDCPRLLLLTLELVQALWEMDGVTRGFQTVADVANELASSDDFWTNLLLPLRMDLARPPSLEEGVEDYCYELLVHAEVLQVSFLKTIRLSSVFFRSSVVDCYSAFLVAQLLALEIHGGSARAESQIHSVLRERFSDWLDLYTRFSLNPQLTADTIADASEAGIDLSSFTLAPPDRIFGDGYKYSLPDLKAFVGRGGHGLVESVILANRSWSLAGAQGRLVRAWRVFVEVCILRQPARGMATESSAGEKESSGRTPATLMRTRSTSEFEGDSQSYRLILGMARYLANERRVLEPAAIVEYSSELCLALLSMLHHQLHEVVHKAADPGQSILRARKVPIAGGRMGPDACRQLLSSIVAAMDHLFPIAAPPAVSVAACSAVRMQLLTAAVLLLRAYSSRCGTNADKGETGTVRRYSLRIFRHACDTLSLTEIHLSCPPGQCLMSVCIALITELSELRSGAGDSGDRAADFEQWRLAVRAHGVVPLLLKHQRVAAAAAAHDFVAASENSEGLAEGGGGGVRVLQVILDFFVCASTSSLFAHEIFTHSVVPALNSDALLMLLDARASRAGPSASSHPRGYGPGGEPCPYWRCWRLAVQLVSGLLHSFRRAPASQDEVALRQVLGFTSAYGGLLRGCLWQYETSIPRADIDSAAPIIGWQHGRITLEGLGEQADVISFLAEVRRDREL
jgi:hypothetical protein